MEEVNITTQLDSLIARVEALSPFSPSEFKVTRTYKETRYNGEYCINILHNDLLILRRCQSIPLKAVEVDSSTIWEELDLTCLEEFMMYAIFGRQNMIDETTSLQASKRRGV